MKKALRINSFALITALFLAVSLFGAALISGCGSAKPQKPDEDPKKESVVADIEDLEERYADLSDDKKSTKEGGYIKEYIEMIKNIYAAGKIEPVKKAIEETSALLKELENKSLDADGDGVLDNADMCPDLAPDGEGPWKALGCPSTEVGYASITVFDEEGNQLAGVSAEGFSPKSIVKLSSEDTLNVAGLEGEHKLVIKAEDKNAELTVTLKKKAKSFYNLTLK